MQVDKIMKAVNKLTKAQKHDITNFNIDKSKYKLNIELLLMHVTENSYYCLLQSELWIKCADEFCKNISRELSDRTNDVSYIQLQKLVIYWLNSQRSDW